MKRRNLLKIVGLSIVAPSTMLVKNKKSKLWMSDGKGSCISGIDCDRSTNWKTYPHYEHYRLYWAGWD